MLPELWALHFYTYEATLVMAGQVIDIRPGMCTLTPPGVVVKYDWPSPSRHPCAHFQLPRAPLDPRKPAARALPRVAAAADLGTDFTPMHAAFDRAADCAQTQPPKAQAIIWELLWSLASQATSASTSELPGEHEAVIHAVELIERNLSRTLRVADIAAEAGVSHTHLTRLFGEHKNATPLAYIRHRRVVRAVHLLTHTTLPIKAVAAEVGMPDMQRLNKLVRTSLGRSPRAIRQNAQRARNRRKA
jgi:AraC-like DNA-binding protein